MTEDPYATPQAVESAIRNAARRAAAAEPRVRVGERIRQTDFDRFLCRIFAEGDRSEWLLKGGTGMLARVPTARATTDVDLFFNSYSLDEAINDLQRLARLDLGDHFRFVYVGHRQIVGGDQQPYANGARVTFEVYLGVQKRSNLGVDLVAMRGEAGMVHLAHPANRLDLPRLQVHPYRLYSVSSQIADKICASMMT